MRGVEKSVVSLLWLPARAETTVRGPLGVVSPVSESGSRLPLERLPADQKHIAALCRSRGKPFLVVTQLLHSMIDHPSPTRAEVLDIYNAVLDGADCLMLTGETAQGRYPPEPADRLIRVAQEAEKAR